MDILNLFPVPVIHRNIANLIDQQTLNDMLTTISKSDMLQNQGKNLYTYNRELLTTDYKDSAITQEIQKTLEFFVQQIYGEPNSKIRLTQSWLNFNPPGTNHLQHNHANSIVSGVLYLSVNDKTGSFKIYRPSAQQRMVIGKTQEWNEYSSEFCRFTPVFGDLYVFPSTVVHGVDINESDITRVSLAFNSFYVGELDNSPLSKLTL